MFNPLEHLSKISGPVALVAFEYDGKHYYFFGDIHFSKENNCESLGISCRSPVDLGTSNCWDIEYLLDRWLIVNTQLGIPTDLFLEEKFLHREAQDYQYVYRLSL